MEERDETNMYGVPPHRPGRWVHKYYCQLCEGHHPLPLSRVLLTYLSGANYLAQRHTVRGGLMSDSGFVPGLVSSSCSEVEELKLLGEWRGDQQTPSSCSVSSRVAVIGEVSFTGSVEAEVRQSHAEDGMLAWVRAKLDPCVASSSSNCLCQTSRVPSRLHVPLGHLKILTANIHQALCVRHILSMLPTAAHV